MTTIFSGVQPTGILNSSNNWQHTWENLPVYVNGEKITRNGILFIVLEILKEKE